MPHNFIRDFDTSPTTVSRFWEKVDKISTPDGCWMWTAYKNRQGYGKFATKKNIQVLAHRFIWTAMNGPIPGDLVVCHRCDNPSCVRPDHLFLGTSSDNRRDCIQKRRNNSAKGCRQGHAKITEDDVRAIRRRHATGETQDALAKAFGISQSAVSYIVLRVNWKHVT